MTVHDETIAPLFLAAYDRHTAYTILRDWTPWRLRNELHAGGFGRHLSHAQTVELEEHLTAWMQRALGALPLRDALLVDEHRGRRVFALICTELTEARVSVPPAMAMHFPPAPADLSGAGPLFTDMPELKAFIQRGAEGLTLVVQGTPEEYPFPTDLAALTAPPPRVYPSPTEPFQQPTGWRRKLALALAVAGVSLLTLPMLIGRIPDHPAGLPLALLTVALLVGIRAGWAGFAGGLCIWLVANLPGFRYGNSIIGILWPGLPIVLAGLFLLSLDRHVRALWNWLSRQVAPPKH